MWTDTNKYKILHVAGDDKYHEEENSRVRGIENAGMELGLGMEMIFNIGRQKKPL